MTQANDKTPQTGQIGPLGDFSDPAKATPAAPRPPRLQRVLLGLVPAVPLALLALGLLLVGTVLRLVEVALDGVARVLIFLAYAAMGTEPPSGKWPNEGTKGKQ